MSSNHGHEDWRNWDWGDDYVTSAGLAATASSPPFAALTHWSHAVSWHTSGSPAIVRRPATGDVRMAEGTARVYFATTFSLPADAPCSSGGGSSSSAPPSP